MIKFAVFVEYDHGPSCEATRFTWAVADHDLDIETAGNVARSWAAKGYPVRIESATPKPHNVTIS